MATSKTQIDNAIAKDDIEEFRPSPPPSSSGFRKAVYLSSAVAAIGGFLCGYDTGAVSGILTMEPFTSRFFTEDNLSYLEGLLLAFFLMTAALGAFFSGFFCDRLSRKYAIVAASGVFSIGILFEVIGANFGLLVAGRLVGGFGAGLMTNGIPLYHSEIAPPDIRGRLISLFTLMSTFGQVAGYFVTFGTSYLPTDWSWRAPWLLQLLVCVLFGASMFTMPFSPRWLIDQGRHDEARQVLVSLRNGDDVQAEYDEIVSELEFERSLGKRTYAELFQRTNRSRLGMASFIAIATSFTGVVAIWYYAPQIFMTAGLTDVSSSIAATGGTGILSLVAAAISLQWCIDQFGRKTLFLWGAAVMGIAMFIVGAMFQAFTYVNVDTGEVVLHNTHARNTILVFIYIFTAAYASTWGLATYVYPAEVFNMRTRAKGLAIVYGFNWAFSILITYCVPLFLASSVSGVYFFFGACCILSFGGVCFLPETKGKSLEEMEYVFGAK